jgi:proline iminopeptidase
MKFVKFMFKLGLGFVVVLVALFAAGYVATMGEYRVAETVVHNPALPQVEINGYKLHAEAFGDPKNPPVLTLHGGPGNDYRMLLSLKALADDYYVIFYDQRGAGLSERVPMEKLTTDSFFDDLDAIIDHFAPGKKISLIGHSWGAMVASGYLGRNPDKINKIVLAEPGFLNGELAKEFMEMGVPKPSFPVLKALVVALLESLHVDGPDDQAMWDYFFIRFATTNDPGNPMTKYYCNQDMNTASFDYWRMGSFTSIANMGNMKMDENDEPIFDMLSGVENYPGTVLFIASECNQLIGEPWQRRQMKFFKKARLVTIKNAGHTMLGEKPEESVKIIREYFKGD